MSRRDLTTGLGLVTALCVATIAANAAELEFAETRLNAPARIQEMHQVDFDGDSRIDLVLIAERRLLVYPGVGNGQLAEKAAIDSPLPDDCVLWDLGDIDGDGNLELLTLGKLGVDAFDLLPAGLRQWERPPVRVETIFRGGATLKPAFVDFAVDLRDGGILDLIVPQASQLWLYTGDGKGTFRALWPLRFKESSSLRVERPWNRASGQDPSASFATTLRIPRIVTGESGGPAGQRDLFMVTGDDIAIYLRDAQGELPVAADSHFHVSDPPQVEGKKRVRLLSLPTLMGDVDGDGQTDLVVTDSGGGRVALHRQAASTWPDAPSSLVTVPGWIVGSQLDDLNGDGRADLILVRIDQVDLWGAISIVTSKRLPVEISVYLAENEKFAERPAFRQTADIPLRFGGEGPGTVSVEAGFVPTATGDYDGDGVTDIVLMSGRDTLEVVGSSARDKNGEWQRIARLRVAGLAEYRTSEVIAADLDGNGSDDLILLGHGWDEAQGDELRVFLRKQ